jgi:phage FluMu protein Com
MCSKSGIVCLLTSDFDEEKYPIPPKHVERSVEVCNHTPMPSGYTAWDEWARQASKTHRQVHCPRCGTLSIWLPKAEANAINRKEAREAKAFAAAYLADFARKAKANKPKKRRKTHDDA